MAERRRRDPDEDRRRGARRRDDDEDDRPRRRRDDDEDDGEEDDRPRARRRRGSGGDRPRRRAAQGDGPWLMAAGLAAACFALSLGLSFLAFGKDGLPAGQDGPAAKLVGLGIGFVASLVIAPLGVIGVKKRRALGKWGIEVEGNMGVATGMVQSAIGGIIGGFALYGLIFTILNGR
jgi:hypothetical protein